MTQFEFALTSLQQRALAIILALIPIAFILICIGSFVQTQIEHHERVSLLEQELNRYQAITRQAPALERQLATVRSSPEWQSLFLPGNAATWLSGTSQNSLASLVRTNGGILQQSTTKVVEESHGFATRIESRVTFTADITALTHILYTMRTPTPLFIIRHLVIRDQEGKLTNPRSAPNQLYVELRVTNFGRPS